MARAQLLLLLFVGTLFVAISLAGADPTGADPKKGGCGNACNCPNEQSCTSGAAKKNCCWSKYGGCKKCDFSKDPKNCGYCNNVCKHPAESCCSSKCVSLKFDPLNCGACGKCCIGGEKCCDGSCKKVCGSCSKICLGHETCCGNKDCVNLQKDNYNCGTCGNCCTHGKYCKYGVCK